MRRGFTLIEVLISVALLSVLVSLIAGVLIQQSLTSTKQVSQRDLEERGRLALLWVGKAVMLAGYGVDPPAAFDFDRYACGTPGVATTCPNGGRDRSDGPDELVVSYRDPDFYRNVTSIVGAGPWTVTLDRPLTQTLQAGRVVELLCSGADPGAYAALQSAAAVGAGTLRLRAIADDDGYYPQAAPSDACFGASALMLVERQRYFVAPDPADGVPALWLERGRGGNELIARGIEDLQLSYQIGVPPAGSAFALGGISPATPPASCSGVDGWLFGSCPGIAGTPLETAAQPDWRGEPYDSVNRYTGHPANIRAVTISVVARSPGPTPDRTSDAVPLLGNRPARAADVFGRAIITVTQPTPNLLSRARFLPPVFAGSNVGGG